MPKILPAGPQFQGFQGPGAAGLSPVRGAKDLQSLPSGTVPAPASAPPIATMLPRLRSVLLRPSQVPRLRRPTPVPPVRP